jgi:peroxiredoxin
MKKPEVGKPAPSVRLNDHHGNIVELGGKRPNWTVLAFFPKAATPG